MNTTLEEISKYCGSIEERINACCDRQVAELLKERICWEIKQAAENEVDLALIREKLNQIIQKKFATKN